MKKLTKLKLAKSAEVLEDNQMKHILGGYSSTMGLRCYNGQCFADVDHGWYTDCERPVSMNVCNSLGLNC